LIADSKDIIDAKNKDNNNYMKNQNQKSITENKTSSLNQIEIQFTENTQSSKEKIKNFKDRIKEMRKLIGNKTKILMNN
jgi:hypothetical protein